MLSKIEQLASRRPLLCRRTCYGYIDGSSDHRRSRRRGRRVEDKSVLDAAHRRSTAVEPYKITRNDKAADKKLTGLAESRVNLPLSSGCDAMDKGRLAAAVSLILPGPHEGGAGTEDRARRQAIGTALNARAMRATGAGAYQSVARNVVVGILRDYCVSTCRRHWAPAQKLVIGANDLCRRAFKLLSTSGRARLGQDDWLHTALNLELRNV